MCLILATLRNPHAFPPLRRTLCTDLRRTCAVPGTDRHPGKHQPVLMIPFDEDLEEEEDFDDLNNTRRRSRQTKEQATYGVFLSSDEEDEEDRQTSQYKRKGGGGGANSKQHRIDDTPVRFVPAGVIEGTKPKDDSTGAAPKCRQITSSDEEILRREFPQSLGPHGIVIGYASSSESEDDTTKELSCDSKVKPSPHSFAHHEHHPGLGTIPISSSATIDVALDDDDDDEPIQHGVRQRGESKVEQTTVHDSDSDESRDDNYEEKAGAKDWRFRFVEMAQEKEEEDKRKRAKAVATASKADIQTSLATSKMSTIYGKGFALLKKMGYSGGGLGKEGSGIINPLQVKIRQKNRGLQDAGEKATEPKAKRFFEADYSAVDILLGRDEDKDKEKGVSKRGHWKRETNDRELKTTRIMYKTAAEIASESRLKQVDRMKAKVDLVTGQVDDEDDDFDVEILDPISIRNLVGGKKAQLRRQQLRLKQLQATGVADIITPAPQTSVRILDMTGPTQRVIEDISQLHAKLSEAADIASESTRLFKGSGGQRDSFPHVIHLDSSMDAAASIDEVVEKRPLAELMHNVRAYISGIESEIAEQSRLKVMTELRFQQCLEKEKVLNDKAVTLKRDSDDIRVILAELMRLRNSRPIRAIERVLNCHRLAITRGSPGALRVSSTDMQNRRVAILKYQSTCAPLGNTSTEMASDAAVAIKTSGDDNDMQLSDSDEVHVISKEHVEDVPIVVDAVLGDISASFKHLFEEYPKLFYRLCLPRLAHQLGLTILKYLDQTLATEPFPSLETASFSANPMYLTTVLIQYRDTCLVPCSVGEASTIVEIDALRRTWHGIIECRALLGLRRIMSHMTIDPGQQNLQPLLTLFEWLGPLSADSLARILRDEFFPKWKRVLDVWLASSNVDLDEVSNWYSGWRSIFPMSLSIHPIIQAELMKGLQKISEHLEHLAAISTAALVPPGLLPSTVNIPPIIADEISQQQHQPASMVQLSGDVSPIADPPHIETEPLPPAPPDDFRPEPPPVSVGAASAESRLLTAVRLTEVLEAVAEQYNILMIPKHGRRRNGKQIYSFGSSSIYIDLGVVYYFSTHSGDWECISPEKLLEKSKV